MGITPVGDLFRADIDSIRATIKSVSELISKIVLGQDAKGSSTAKVNKLQNDLKLQSAQLEKIVTKKRAAEQEVASLTAKNKRLESELAERKKTFATKQTEFENEKATWENKYKLFNNELKKKDNVIKKYSEISGASTKDGNVINNLEVVGEFTKPDSKFYGSSEVAYPDSAILRVHVFLPENHSRPV
jgi:DNA repair exonuclease SbcCD ATPase subunit